MRGEGVFKTKEVAVMSRTVSPLTGKVYGVERVCSAWGVPRSSFYNEHNSSPRADEESLARPKRGPRPRISDDELLALILEDL